MQLVELPWAEERKMRQVKRRQKLKRLFGVINKNLMILASQNQMPLFYSASVHASICYHLIQLPRIKSNLISFHPSFNGKN